MLKNEEVIEIGQYLSTQDHNGEKVEGKVISITELKGSLWVSIKTQEGMRTVKFT